MAARRRKNTTETEERGIETPTVETTTKPKATRKRAAKSKAAKATSMPPVEEQDLISPSAVALYLKEIRDQELLTDEETMALGYRIRDGRLARDQLNEYGDELDPDTQAGLLDLQRRGEAAVNDLTEHYLPFVVYIAKQYTKYEVPIEDLIQEGNVALLEAAKRFDPDKGKFSGYAGHWIQATIRNYIRDHQWGPVSQPHSAKMGKSTIERERRKLVAQGIEPTDKNLAEKANLELDKIEEIMGIWAGSRCVSLFASMNSGDDDDDNLDLGSQLSQEDDITMLEAVSQRTLRYSIMRVLQEVLDPIEEICLVLLFGLEDNVPRTYEAIAIEINYAKSSVHNICERAKEKLRQSSQKCNLEAFLES